MQKRFHRAAGGTDIGILIAVSIALLLGAYLIFEFGRLQADYNVLDHIAEKRQFSADKEALESEIVVLKQEIALLQTEDKIEQEAYKAVELNLSELQQKIQEQREAIAFYRGIVSPQDGGRGLRVQDLKLSRGADEQRYQLRVVLVQVMQHDRSVKGEVDFSVEGALNGVLTTYTLEQLLPDGVNSSWPFSFRYFQDFERELVLPDGFEPAVINIEVISRTKSIANVKQSFEWAVG